MYMTDINPQTVRGKTTQEEQEDPKSAKVIFKKIGLGMLWIFIGLLIFTLSSAQISLIAQSVYCKPGEKGVCPYPGDPDAIPYKGAQKQGKAAPMSPLRALADVGIGVVANALMGMETPTGTKGTKVKMKGGARKVKPQRGGYNLNGSKINDIRLQWGSEGWRPFDVRSGPVGWPYKGNPTEPYGIEEWLAKTQITAWSIPRQWLQAVFTTLANFISMEGKIGQASRFIITLFMQAILTILYLAAPFVAAIVTFWGGFVRNIFDGDLAGLVWGFFFTWAIILYNMLIQPMELLASFFVIPFTTDGVNWIKLAGQSVRDGGFREIILAISCLIYFIVVLTAFMPLINASQNS